jgi:hypothetical protein
MLNLSQSFSLMKAVPEAFIDLTAPPYGADPTGQRDSTEAICRAYSDVMRLGAEAFERTRAALAAGERIEGSLEADPEHEKQWVLCPHIPPVTRILYLPEGVYRVSDTLVYDNEGLHTSHLDELNRCIHWLGDGSSKTIIRLDANAPGFGAREERPVVQFCAGRKSSVAMQNTFEGISVEVGAGNPGAVGVAFFANNTGAMRDVRVASLDPDGAGFAGVGILDWNSSCAYLKKIDVVGFDYGLHVRHPRLYTVMEDIRVRSQRRTGVWIREHNAVLRGLRSENRVPALRVTGAEAMVQLMDAHCANPESTAVEAAIDFRAGNLHLRDVEIRGYPCSLASLPTGEQVSGSIDHWSSAPVSRLFKRCSNEPLRLAVRDTPGCPVGEVQNEWTAVTDFGADPGGEADSTAALQAAFASGSSHICFPPGRYRLDGVVTVPASVERVNFLYCDFVSGERLRSGAEHSCFRITESGGTPLVFEDLFAWVGLRGPFHFIEHAAQRDLVLSDLHTQEIPLYRNTVSGSRVYIENCACTSQSAPELSGFDFHGQDVWARQFNPERAAPQVRIRGGRFWGLGFKTENPGAAFSVTEGAEADIIGGIFNQYRHWPDRESPPLVEVTDASLSLSASTTDWRSFVAPMPMIRECQAGILKEVAWEMLARREPHLVVIPLYVARTRSDSSIREPLDELT